MAWTAPRTWVTSEVVTAAKLQPHIRDNFLTQDVAQVTTAGDLVYASAANALTRLAIGATDRALEGSSGLLSWDVKSPNKAFASTADTVVNSANISPTGWSALSGGSANRALVRGMIYFKSVNIGAAEAVRWNAAPNVWISHQIWEAAGADLKGRFAAGGTPAIWDGAVDGATTDDMVVWFSAVVSGSNPSFTLARTGSAVATVAKGSYVESYQLVA